MLKVRDTSSSIFLINVEIYNIVFECITYFWTFLFILAYDFEAFVGNTGGYIGLFLGYALLQIPGIIIYVLTWCGHFLFRWDKPDLNPRKTEEIVHTAGSKKLLSHLPQISVAPLVPMLAKVHEEETKMTNELQHFIRNEIEAQLRKINGEKLPI